MFANCMVCLPHRSGSPVSLQKLSKRTKFVRSIVREVAGLAPYERRITELLKVSTSRLSLPPSRAGAAAAALDVASTEFRMGFGTVE